MPGLFSNAFVAHKSPVESKKYFKGDEIEPNLVGEPKARPLQLIKSSLVQKISPDSGITSSICSTFDDIFGTVLRRTSKPTSSIPSAIACAKFLTYPDAE